MTYELRVNTEARTTKEVYESDLQIAYGSKEAFVSQMIAHIEPDIITKVTEEFVAKGYTVNVTNFYFEPSWEIRQAPSLAFPHNLVNIVRLTMKADYSIYSETPFSSSPLAPWIMPVLNTVLKWAVITFLAAIIVILIFEWLKSMTTTSTIIYEYDEDGNLISKTVKTEPDILGIGLVGIFAIIFAIILLFWFKGKPRRGGEG